MLCGSELIRGVELWPGVGVGVVSFVCRCDEVGKCGDGRSGVVGCGESWSFVGCLGLDGLMMRALQSAMLLR